MTDLSVIGIRFALYADLMLLTGLAAFPLYALGSDERRNSQFALSLTRPLQWFCALGLLFSALGILILTANMYGIGAFSVDMAMLLTMIRDTDVGAAWLCRMIALLVATAAASRLAASPAIASAILALTGAIALATLAWSGHAGATEGLAGAIHRINDALHMIAAAIWLGALAAFLLMLRTFRGAEQAKLAARCLDQFARVGTICVLIIVATGLINADLIVGIANAGRSLASPYGQLLLIKLLLFGSMLLLAGANRWRLTPALTASVVNGDSRAAIGRIRRSIAAEAAVGIAILVLVAWFGTLEPQDLFALPRGNS